MAKGYCAAQWYGDRHLDCISQCSHCQQEMVVVKRDYGNGCEDHYMLPIRPDVAYPLPAVIAHGKA